MMSSQARNLRKLDRNRLRELMGMTIIQHDVPYSLFESKDIIDLCKYLNPDFEPIPTTAIMSYVWEFFLSQKEKLKQIMSKSLSRMCLTSDHWTAIDAQQYVCLTVHFVDENWKLNRKILSFVKMVPPYCEFELAKEVLECLIDWGIDKKLFSITLDNSLMNDNMKDVLKKRLSSLNSLLCDGDLFHVRSCADILNLIVQEALKVISITLQKIRDSIMYVKESEERRINFRHCVQQVGGIDTSMNLQMDLRLDVSIGWNSTHKMLKSGIRYRRAFARLASNDSSYKCCPSDEEWKRAEEISTFLEPFEIIASLMAQSPYLTLNMYFMQMSKIELLLKENVVNVDPMIQDMAQRMKEKFDKYWGDYSMIFALGTILDPRFKFELIKYCYSLLDPIICHEKIETIKNKLYFVYSQYKDIGASSSYHDIKYESSSKVSMSMPTVRKQPSDDAWEEEMYKEAFADYLDFKRRDTTSVAKSERDYYLEDPILEPLSFLELDILDYWKANQIQFPHLSRMACDILSIPITTAANESLFSIGSCFFAKYRSRFLSKNNQTLLCIRNWLYGFKDNNEDDGIDDDDQDSNTISDDEADKVMHLSNQGD